MSPVRYAALILLALGALSARRLQAGDDLSRDDALEALRRAVTFFHRKVAVGGGYVWRYSADLSKREGESKVGATTIWVQPPGTPSVGEALVEAYELTGEDLCLAAARDAAMGLVKGQLHSGGWTYRVDFDAADRRRYAFLADGQPARRARNVSTLDDDTTQSAIRFLTRYDRATKFADTPVHDAVLRALESVLAAQHPNGAWSQGFSGPADPSRPVKPASYSETGEYQRIKEYWDLYTLNDNVLRDVFKTLLFAERVYGDERYRKAAERGGDFLVLAQMPDPQPGWAQQYDFDMRPTWARKFEPPAITGGESQQAMTTLLDLYELTGERKYFAPVPRALAYYKRCLLPDGRLARFYEPKTNRPLYFTREYELTYDDGDMPTHYAFKVGSSLASIERRVEKLSSGEWRPRRDEESRPERPAADEARTVIAALDERGAWVEEGRLRSQAADDPNRRIIDTRTFARNLGILARFIGKEATAGGD